LQRRAHGPSCSFPKCGSMNKSCCRVCVIRDGSAR
jgi:hypothetical protein